MNALVPVSLARRVPPSRTPERNRLRALRAPGAKPRTITLRQMTRERSAGPEEPLDAERPRVRGDCARGPRPCPWVGCRFHLFLDATARGGIKLNFPGIEPDELRESCALDVADRGGATLDAVARAMNVTRERARQIEQIAFARLEATSLPTLEALFR